MEAQHDVALDRGQGLEQAVDLLAAGEKIALRRSGLALERLRRALQALAMIEEDAQRRRSQPRTELTTAVECPAIAPRARHRLLRDVVGVGAASTEKARHECAQA